MISISRRIATVIATVKVICLRKRDIVVKRRRSSGVHGVRVVVYNAGQQGRRRFY